MTEKISKILPKQCTVFLKKHALTLIFVILTALAVFLSDEIKEFAKGGLVLCGEAIIPTLFPFMIFSDLILTLSGQNENNVSTSLFEKLFGVNAACVTSFICGILCGFPIGAVCVKNLYDGGIIDKEDAEYMLGVCSVPSLAFVVSGVGAGLLGSAKTGLGLWIALIFSAILIAFVFRPKEKKIKISRDIYRQRFDFVASVKNSGYTMIAICSFIIFFSVIVGLFGMVIKNPYFYSLTASFFEIGNASAAIANCSAFTPEVKLVLLGFALGFSGISVYMQTASIVSDSKLSLKKYLIMKLFMGTLTSLLVLLIMLFR